MHPPEETIVALSTPPGRGAIGIIRLSGPEALATARKIFKARSLDRIEACRARLGAIQLRPDGGQLDIGYLTYYPAGRSYTGEDVAELSCHGSPVVLRRILSELVALGARPAKPGEFTYRAVLHGRIDLAQAEGVRDLINASTELAAWVARRQMQGDLSRSVASIREELVEIISRLEARVEFAEEPEVSAFQDRLSDRVEDLRRKVHQFVSSYRRGRLIRGGASVVLAGRPNAGKSSLFNLLLRTERAIVSAEPGTTRDTLTERIDLDGIPVTLVDTAGLNTEAAGVEKEGVIRAHRQIDEADLVLALCACDADLAPEDQELLARCGPRALRVASKSDLPARRAGRGNGTLRVSAVTGEGKEELRAAIFERLMEARWLSPEEILISDARHHEALSCCATHLSRAAGSAAWGASEEIILVDLYAALNRIGEITGGSGLEAVYDRIFSTFCIGK